MVRKYPHEVTIYAAGPVTNLALAQAIDPEFASLAKELILMGGGINPITDNPEFTKTPHREFNLWMDPEASRRVLRSPWARIVVTTVDISVKTRMDKTLTAEIAKGTSPSAQYVAKYANRIVFCGTNWRQSRGWIPQLLRARQKCIWTFRLTTGQRTAIRSCGRRMKKPAVAGPLVEVQEDLNKEKFYKEFVELMTRPTPGAHWF